MTTTITGKNQITLPAALVKDLDLRPGVQIEWSKNKKGDLVGRRKLTRGELARKLIGCGKKYLPPGESAVEGLLRDRAEDAALDQWDEQRGL